MKPMTSQVDQALVDELIDRFPNKNPTPKDSIENIMYRAGRQSIIDFLQEQYDVQSKTILQ